MSVALPWIPTVEEVNRLAQVLKENDARIAELEAENSSLKAQLKEAKHKNVNLQFIIDVSQLSKGLGQWQPLKDGRVEIDSHGDNMGIWKLKYIDVLPNGSLHAQMATLSMAGESIYGYGIKFPHGYAVCQLVDAKEEHEPAT